MRLMALDYGSVTVGVAVTDPLGITAQPLETIPRKQENHLRKTYSRLETLVRELQVDAIILGRPVFLNGAEGERAEFCELFRQGLERRLAGLQIPVIYHDECLTTVAADEILAEMEIRPEDRKQYIDAVAAAVILRDYMNTKEFETWKEKRT